MFILIIIPFNNADGEETQTDACLALSTYPWVFLRDDRPIGIEDIEESVEFIAVGDIMLSRYVGEVIARRSPQYPFSATVEILKKADIAFANLENPISQRGELRPGSYRFRAEPEVIEGLVYAGFDILSLANNHTLDYGEEALQDTIESLEKAKILTVGINEGDNEPVIKKVKGLAIAFLAYTDIIDPYDIPGETGLRRAQPAQLERDIKTAEDEADFVIVSFHWGEEYQPKASSRQRSIAYAVLKAGADLIIGHHPHVVQEMEMTENGLVFYSLGNFVFDQPWPYTRQAIILRCLIDKRGLRGVQVLPIVIARDGQPSLAPLEEGEKY